MLRITAAIIAMWTAVSLFSLFQPELLSNNTARFINVALMSAFTLLHGAARYGWRNIAAYFVIGVVVTNVTENMSIVSGFPFGQYHHAAAMGPKIWHVPIIVGPIFTVAGYLAWVLAGVLLRDVFRTSARSGVSRPLIAAFITTSWDFCVDAIGGTVNRDWVWAEGGPWFGVPWMNFFGWMLTMWIIFQLYVAWLARHEAPRAIPANSPYWTQVMVFWLLITLQFPLIALIAPDIPLTDPAGGQWQSGDLFQSMALTSIFTMLFTVVLAWAVLARERSDSNASS